MQPRRGNRTESVTALIKLQKERYGLLFANSFRQTLSFS
jgi:hypothetical protein